MAEAETALIEDEVHWTKGAFERTLGDGSTTHAHVLAVFDGAIARLERAS